MAFGFFENPFSLLIRTARTETGIWCKERWNFLPLVHGGRVGEKSLGINTLQAAEPPYSVNNGPIK